VRYLSDVIENERAITACLRQAERYETSDLIRDHLKNLKIKMKDTKKGA
jgi:cysteinyl-tRNA synthetase